MRSNDLAKIAGVTVRTLRHYHQIGLLAEPERASNNYRRYSAHHLIRLLRIRRLSAIGFPLETICSLLDGADDLAKDALDELDRELEAQIQRLISQRELIENIRATQGSLDTPVELAPFNDVLCAGMSENNQRIHRGLAILLSHFVGKDVTVLADYYRRFVSHSSLHALIDIENRFEGIAPEIPDAELSAITEEYLALLEPLARELDSLRPLSISKDDLKILNSYINSNKNSKQRKIISELSRRMNEKNCKW